MRRIDAAALPLLALGAACVLVRLGSVPALTLDEAWIGLFSQRLVSAGAFTPHQMNHYTGPLFSWAVAAVAAWRGPGIESLRLLGACLNALALAGIWLHLRRRISPEAALAWAVLAAGSAFLLLKSRLAWEVYAFQPLLIAGTLAALTGPRGTIPLVLLTWFGAQNHFIFLSVPASLVVMFGARAAWRDEAEALAPLRSATAALAAGVALAVLKNPLSDASWVAHRAAWTAALTAVPAAAAFAAWAAPDEWRLLPFRRLRRPLQVFFALTVAAFFVWHLAPMVQLLAGPVVFKRVFSLALPLPLSLVLHAWGLFLAGVVVWNAAGAWLREDMTPHERTLLLWPWAFAAVFIAFRHTSSLRYYSLPGVIWLAALAAAWPRFARADKKGLWLCAAAAALCAQGLIWRELREPRDRAPLSFKIGWRKENSRDFSRKDGLFAAFDSSGACQIAHAERSFTAIPLQYHASLRSVPCDAGLAFDSDQCPECPAPPYFRWSVAPAPR